jgi:hypothetical protein
MPMTSWFIIACFLAVVLVVFVGMLLIVRRREHEIAWLEKHGIRIIATVVHVQLIKEAGLFQKQTMLMNIVRGMQPSHVEDDMGRRCELKALWIHPQSQRRYVFKKRYYENRERHYAPGDTIEVLVDMQHPRRYIVYIGSPS